MKLLTGGQFRELDRYTIEHEPISSIDLMERAAQEIASTLMQRWDSSRPFCVFAGPGNNGGDGLAVARILGNNGYRVRVWLFNVKESLSADCQTNCERLSQVASVELHEVVREFDFPAIDSDEIIVDALFGTGLSKPILGGFAHVIRKINALPNIVVSIDVPSGLRCEDNTYTDTSCVVRATLTLTIQLPKMAFLFAENEQYVGEWQMLDIRLSAEGLSQMTTPYAIMELEQVAQLLHTRSRFAHKGTMGHALLSVGCMGMAGAAILSAKACLRSGVGKLTVHTPRTNLAILQQAVPEAVIRCDVDTRVITSVPHLDAFASIGVGPGMGRDSATEQAVGEYLALADVPMVIDADAINLLNGHPDWTNRIPDQSILTPHPRELEVLVGHCLNSYERIAKAQQFAVDHRAYVVVKGHYSAICMPDGQVLFCPAGNPGMATPGSGDVLTGILAGLLAQGYTPSDAVQLGVWLHALAGDAAAEALGEECMLASDIIQYMPQAFRKLKSKITLSN